MWSPRPGRSSSTRIDCQVVFAKPSMAATAFESATRLSKLVEVDVKLLIAPYKAELPRSRNLLYAQRNSTSPATERDASIGRPSRAIKERSIVITYVQDRCLLSPSPPGPRGAVWKHDGRGA